MTAAIPASRSAAETAALYCGTIVPHVPTFPDHHCSSAATEAPVSGVQQRATSLPEPVWGLCVHLQWLYPLHTLALGQSIFVADRAGLAEAAARAVRTYTAQLRKHIGGSRGWFKCEWRKVHGIDGVVIGRIA